MERRRWCIVVFLMGARRFKVLQGPRRLLVLSIMMALPLISVQYSQVCIAKFLKPSSLLIDMAIKATWRVAVSPGHWTFLYPTRQRLCPMTAAVEALQV